MREKNNSKKIPSFRIAHCGTFPKYQLDKIPLNEKNIIYLVSVGKEKFEGKWVERFVNFIKEIKPKKTIIVVADSLQRFNIEVDENISEIDALRESEERGQQWVKKYKPYFSKLDIDYEFIHWATLKEDKDFKQYSQEIIDLSMKNTVFQEALLNSSREYTERPSRLNSSIVFNQEKAEINSCNFLREECAVFQVLAKENNNKAIVYPGIATKVLDFSIQHINKNYRTKNPFYWLDMRPTKDRNKNKRLETQLSKWLEKIKTLQCETSNNSSSPSFFRQSSLNENHSYRENTLDNSIVLPFFRRPSLDGAPSYSKKIPVSYILN